MSLLGALLNFSLCYADRADHTRRHRRRTLDIGALDRAAQAATRGDAAANDDPFHPLVSSDDDDSDETEDDESSGVDDLSDGDVALEVALGSDDE